MAGQPAVALLGARVGHGVALLAAEGLCEPLCIAVGSWRVLPGAGVSEVQGAAGLSERLGGKGGSLFAHHPPAIDSLAVEPGDGPVERADHR